MLSIAVVDDFFGELIAFLAKVSPPHLFSTVDVAYENENKVEQVMDKQANSLVARSAPSSPLDCVSTRSIPVSWDVPRTLFVWWTVVSLSEATVSLLTFVMSPSIMVICRHVPSALVKMWANSYGQLCCALVCTTKIKYNNQSNIGFSTAAVVCGSF